MLDGISKSLQNFGSVLNQNYSGFNGIPSKLIQIKSIMKLGQVQSNVLEAAWYKVNYNQ